MAELLPGTRIDDLYEILAPIGRGGMASVYRARELERDREVAIKVLALDDSGEDLKKRFFRELLLATRVRHPNIVDVFDFGAMQPSGAPYIVMELLQGVTLHRELRRGGPMDPQRVARLFPGALQALGEAHALGVVHKDLKPSNLFLCRQADGTEDLVILDFGIAHRMQSGEATRAEWTVTPAYASPEYLRRHEVRPALDVYQMGLVLAEALAGRPVVSSTDSQECFRVHLSGNLPLPMEALQGPLGPVIRRAVSADPAQRYAHAGELLDALREACHPEPVTLRRVAPVDPSQEPLGRSASFSDAFAEVRASVQEEATRLLRSPPSGAPSLSGPASAPVLPEGPPTRPTDPSSAQASLRLGPPSGAEGPQGASGMPRMVLAGLLLLLSGCALALGFLGGWMFGPWGGR